MKAGCVLSYLASTLLFQPELLDIFQSSSLGSLFARNAIYKPSLNHPLWPLPSQQQARGTRESSSRSVVECLADGEHIVFGHVSRFSEPRLPSSVPSAS